jgi:hypothetical protein
LFHPKSVEHGLTHGDSVTLAQDGDCMLGVREIIGTIIGCVFFLVIGSFGLFWPENVRAYALRTSANRLAKFNPFLSWMKTPQYIWSLRIIGALALGAFILIMIVWLRNGK